MRVDELDYDVPDHLVAQVPACERPDARLLVLGAGRPSAHRAVRDLPALLRPGDLLVVNDTRVLPARLVGRRKSGGRVEILALEPEGASSARWSALVRAGGALRSGEVIGVGEGLEVSLLESRGAGAWWVEGRGAALVEILERVGRMPLPPYIHRADDDPRGALDRERYQTTFAREDGAVAAPTAGLHLTPGLLDEAQKRGVEVASVTLHVGLGTFAPVRTERFEDHPMHEEAYAVPEATARAVAAARDRDGRVVAVGTTVVRALEAAAQDTLDGLPRAGAGRTRLLILPGHVFRAVDGLLTNFHLPRSTLLALVAAFAGRERVLAAYREAIARGYRLFSYGDAMLLWRAA